MLKVFRDVLLGIIADATLRNFLPDLVSVLPYAWMLAAGWLTWDILHYKPVEKLVTNCGKRWGKENKMLCYLIFAACGALLFSGYWYGINKALSSFTKKPANEESRAALPVASPSQSMSSSPGAMQAGRDINVYTAPPQPGMQAGLRSLLIPADDPMPATPSNLVVDAEDKVAFVGFMVTAFPSNLKSFNLIKMGGESVLAVEWNSPRGIVINATLKDASGQLIAKINKNVFHSYADNDYDVRSDANSILILNGKDEKVLYVRYMNPRAIEVLGIFNNPPSPTLQVEEGRCIVGNQVIDGIISSKASGGGHWFDLDTALSVGPNQPPTPP